MLMVFSSKYISKMPSSWRKEKHKDPKKKMKKKKNELNRTRNTIPRDQADQTLLDLKSRSNRSSQA